MAGRDIMHDIHDQDLSHIVHTTESPHGFRYWLSWISIANIYKNNRQRELFNQISFHGKKK